MSSYYVVTSWMDHGTEHDTYEEALEESQRQEKEGERPLILGPQGLGSKDYHPSYWDMGPGDA